MNKSELISQIRRKKSFLCIGLDTEVGKLPAHIAISDDPVFDFNRQIIDATHDLAVAYKPNLAFYESQKSNGWRSLEKTIDYIRRNYPGIFIIADAKRGDIGNTSLQYAKAFLDDEEGLGFDAITVAPYMGQDSVSPYLNYASKWAIVLILTSNKGAADFQYKTMDGGRSLWEHTLETAASWGSPDNMMFVIGATQASMLSRVRQIVPDHFLLVPGVGAQGGNLQEVVRFGLNKEVGLLINVSRSVIFASSGSDFAHRAREEAFKLQQQMQAYIR